ncbi:nucleotide sugar dehydrogenase [Caulobacter segnis]|uniref:UDP-glucose 6-dehydrogenase n=1 Tax=Caulobacter segnis TaxID=88688 RepID=A0A2W5VA49_9CAUL|nr:nucleotide sugar dehydrogenase [Caulobacter segnis]PZR32245.1 MAG: nucleotide sugar dehydrogenase [Caulobacter segnis]
MKIAIYGLGYVGLTAAGCLTKEGHSVIGVEVNEDKVMQLNAGRSPITEPGLDDLLTAAVKEGRFLAVQHVGDRLAECDMAIVCVGTPSAPDGSHNMSYIAEVSRQIALSVNRDRKEPLTVVYRSTIRPGSIEGLVYPVFHSILGDDARVIELVYNPEFLRESVAIKDYFAPPKIVIGTADGAPSKNMDLLNANIDAPVFYTGYREAEFTKFVDNTFHAVKVAFANEIGRVCLQLGISAKKVHEIFVSDTKLNISAYYTRPGGAFGGSCLPKDVRALQYISGDVGGNTHLIDSLLRSNDSHKQFLFQHCVKGLEPKAKVLMLGLAFKTDTDDLRESPNLDLARRLLQAGYDLSIYDPALEPSKLVGQNLGYAYSQLPSLADLLVSKEQIEGAKYDVVIDTGGRAGQLALSTAKLIDINALQ